MPETEHAGKAANELLDEIRVRRQRCSRIPRAIAVEDHDIAAVNAAGVINNLVNQDPVIDLEGIFHRTRRYKERLDRIGLDHDRDHQRDHDQDHQLAQEPGAAVTPGRGLAPGGPRTSRSGRTSRPGGRPGGRFLARRPLGVVRAGRRPRFWSQPSPACPAVSAPVVEGPAAELAAWPGSRGGDSASLPEPASGSAPGVTPLIRAPSAYPHRVSGPPRLRPAGRTAHVCGPGRPARTRSVAVIHLSLAPLPRHPSGNPPNPAHQITPQLPTEILFGQIAAGIPISQQTINRQLRPAATRRPFNPDRDKSRQRQNPE